MAGARRPGVLVVHQLLGVEVEDGFLVLEGEFLDR